MCTTTTVVIADPIVNPIVYFKMVAFILQTITIKLFGYPLWLISHKIDLYLLIIKN